MDKKKLNISNIEAYLMGLIDNKVSANTFASVPPAEFRSEWNDVCVIDTSSSIRDLDAYGKGAVLVWLYARPLASGAKNGALMSALESKLVEVIEGANDSTYRISRRNTYSDYDSKRQWHCNIIVLNITIF